MNNPNDKVSWEVDHWKIGKKEILDTSSPSKFNLFFIKRWHRVHYQYSDKYRAKFKIACKSLNKAIRESQKAKKNAQSIKQIENLKKRYKILQKDELRIKKKCSARKKKIRMKQKALKAEESGFAELLQSKINHRTTVNKLQNCVQLKQDLNDQLSKSTIARLRYSLGTPDASVAKLSSSLTDIQNQLKVKTSFTELEIKKLIEQENCEILSIEKKLIEKDTTLLETLQNKVEKLKKIQAKNKHKLAKVQKQKQSTTALLSKHGCQVSKIKITKSKKKKKSQKEIPQKLAQSVKVLQAIEATNNKQLLELFTLLFAHLQVNFEHDIVCGLKEDKKNNKIAILLQEPIRFWLSAKKYTKKAKGGVVFSLGDNSSKQIVLHFTPKGISFPEGISLTFRLPKIPLVPKKMQEPARSVTIKVQGIAFKNDETVTVTVSWGKEISKNVKSEMLLSAWTKESIVITDASIKSMAYIKKMGRLESAS